LSKPRSPGGKKYAVVPRTGSCVARGRPRSRSARERPTAVACQQRDSSRSCWCSRLIVKKKAPIGVERLPSRVDTKRLFELSSVSAARLVVQQPCTSRGGSSADKAERTRPGVLSCWVGSDLNGRCVPSIQGQRRAGLLTRRRRWPVTADDDGRDSPAWAGWLRQSPKIDELPELINVLSGHMSLVGRGPEGLSAKYDCEATRSGL